MALIGFAAVFELFPAAYVGARTAGAAYLLYLAYRMWRNASTPMDALPEPAHHAFRQRLFINLFNPKSVLFAAAVLIAIFPGGLGAVNSAVIAVNHLLIELSFYTALAFCLNTEAVTARYLRARTWIDRGAAAVLGALGLRDPAQPLTGSHRVPVPGRFRSGGDLCADRTGSGRSSSTSSATESGTPSPPGSRQTSKSARRSCCTSRSDA